MTGASAKGVGAAEYGNVLLRAILPAATRLYGSTKNWVFMQDGASSHTAGSIRQILQQHRIKTLKWPPNSPDLNPIENMWAMVQRRRNL